MTDRIVAALALSVALSLTACDDGAEPDAGRDASMDGSTSDAGDLCERDSDCADDLYCNGAERCQPGSAMADAQGCVAGSDPCSGGATCDEERNVCEAPDCTNPDADSDGHDAIACGGDDCDDDDPNRYPGNAEVCDDGHDEDCDPDTLGGTDADTDGFVSAACCNGSTCGDDCADDDININPGASEVCDGVDNDCDATVDVSSSSLCPGGLCVAGRCDLDAWDRAFGSGDLEDVTGVAVDAMGNVIVVGVYNEEVDFGGGPEPAPGASSTNDDAFIAAYGPDESFLWVQTLTNSGDNDIHRVDTDEAGNVYVTGRGKDFGGDPNAAYLASFDSAGALRWHVDLPPFVGGFNDLEVRGGPAQTDVRVLVSGSSGAAYDLGGGSTSPGSFVASFDGAGAFRWSSEVSARAVTHEGSSGRVFAVGQCAGTSTVAGSSVDCDERGVLVVQIDDSGAPVAAEGFAGRGLVTVFDAIWGGSSLVVGGQLSGVGSRVTFESGRPITGQPTEPASFLVSLSPGLAYEWQRSFFARLQALAVASTGRLIGVGSFTTDANFGCGTRPFTDGHEMFIARWNPASGSCLDTDVYRSSGTGASIRATSISIGVADSAAVGGNFTGVVDLGDGEIRSETRGGTPSQDGFVMRFGL